MVQYRDRNALIRDFKRFLEIDLQQKEKTVQNHMAVLYRLMRRCDPLTATKEDLRDYLSQFKESPKTYAWHLCGLKRLYRDFFKKPELVDSFKFPKYLPRSKLIPSKKELREFSDHLSSEDLALFLVLASSGLRRSEVVTLKINEVDFERRMIMPSRTSSTKFSWVGFFNEEARSALKDFMAGRRDRRESLFPYARAKLGVIWGGGWCDLTATVGEKAVVMRSDAEILDELMQRFVFYCSIDDPNQTLYICENGIWKEESYVEGILKAQFSEIYGDLGEVKKANPHWAMDYIKGKAMSRNDIVKKPLELVPFKNCFLVVKDFEEEIDGKSVHHKQGDTLQLSSKYFYENSIPWEYDPNAKCQKFKKWLKGTVRKEDIRIIQEMMGYCLYTCYPEPVFFILVGSGVTEKPYS
ncbi:MAG: tyrosine-type recombinase/integrase [Candidatus Methanosuratincola sp.]|nr:tyrosine-type recombinase/integrase [Candidatus Methanosuratincola sp.]